MFKSLRSIRSMDGSSEQSQRRVSGSSPVPATTLGAKKSVWDQDTPTNSSHPARKSVSYGFMPIPLETW